MIVLIVDDVAVNRKLLKATLEAEGHDTLEAADGAEGLALLDQQPVDAVISDILMPTMDGYRFCREVRKSASHRHLPFVIYTSTYDSPADMDLAMKVGADRYVKKPAAITVLLQALRDAVDREAAGRSEVAPLEDTEVLKQYSEALVRKLEHKNNELHRTMEALRAMNDLIMSQNADLDRRIKERTAALESSNRELESALGQVRELSGMLPMCLRCRRIRDDKKYWHTVESYISHHTKARFSHGYCPDCYAREVKSIDKELENEPADR